MNEQQAIQMATPAQVEYIMNGRGHGSTASEFIRRGGDPRALRPYKLKPDGPDFVAANDPSTGKPIHKFVGNNSQTMLKDVWDILDDSVTTVAKSRLRAAGDLRDAGLTVVIEEGMGKAIFQYQNMTDITKATIAMEPRVQSQEDRPEYELLNMPLPLVFKDLSFGVRELLISKNRGPGVDVDAAGEAAHRVAEMVDDLVVGNVNPYSWGGGKVWGYTTFEDRMTKVLTNPNAGGWNPNVTVTEVLSMRQMSINAFHYGPWVLYTSTGFSEFFQEDYSAAKGDRLLRERILAIEGIQDVRSLDNLSGFQMVLVEMKARNVRLVIGMDIMAIQYNMPGDFETCIKVMCLINPNFRSDSNNSCGIVHGVAP